jgi:hypothetical protein
MRALGVKLPYSIADSKPNIGGEPLENALYAVRACRHNTPRIFGQAVFPATCALPLTTGKA